MKAFELVMIMSLALSACSAQDDASTFGVVVPLDQLASDDVRERGRAVFLKNCAICHGSEADGNGVRREGLSRRPPNFGNKDWRENAEPGQLYAVVSEGKRGTSMPAWPTLDDEERWAVVAYVLRVSGEGP